MFLGRFNHNLDDKGRLTVPARFRDLLLAGGAYIMQGFDKNLMVLPAATFDAFSQRVNAMSLTDSNARLLRRMLFSTADKIDVDRVGRILIPQFLRDAAELQSGVMVVGVGDYFELWSPQAWEGQVTQLQDAQSNADRFAAFNLTSDG